MPAISAQAPAKTILFGEHAVVYGYAAIAIPVRSITVKVAVHAKPNEKPGSVTILPAGAKKRLQLVHLDKNHPTRMAIETVFHNLSIDVFPPIEIIISSTIPTAAGLGSSASFSVALTRAISRFIGLNLDETAINQIAFEIEKQIHGMPSGIDNTVIAYDQPIIFRKDFPHEVLMIKNSVHMVIADSGERTLTKKVVSEVRKNREKNSEFVDSRFKEIHQVVLQARHEFLESNIPAVGRLMSDNHQLLMELGVSCPALDHLVQTALQNGAYGAKLCGGGQGGIITALASEDSLRHLKAQLEQAGAVSCLVNTLTPHSGEKC